MSFSKSKLALAVLAAALLIPATAFATHTFTDVPDGKFFADPVKWAADNLITTGTGDGTTFSPDDSVTRGESVTFLKRYHDNVVQPALDALDTGDVLANTYTQAEVDALIAVATSTTCSGTVTGFRIYDETAVADNKDWFLDVQLPCVASTALTLSTVNFAPHAAATDDDAACTGTAAAPTAPFGKVCIYLSGNAGIDGLRGSDTRVNGSAFDTRGFSIRGATNTGAGGDIFAYMTWAYKAPLLVIVPLPTFPADPG